MPKVSICTSVLNQSEHLKTMIASVVAQTFTDWELVIVDDGSTEDIKALCTDERIRYFRMPNNLGIPHGINFAMNEARGEYLQPLAADEFIWDKKLEVQVAWMDEHPDIGCTWGLPTPNIGRPWQLGECASWEQFYHKAHNRSREAWIRTLLRQENIPIGGAAMLMRTECYKTIGQFDSQFHAVSDLEWFVRFFQHYQGWILPYRLADAVHPADRQSMQKQWQFNDDIKRLHELHKIVLPPTSGRVTIGLPVRNMEKFIGASIQSVLDQTFTDFDLVVADDASEDGTLAEILKFTDPRIKVLQFAERMGVALANNHILGTCETQFYVPFAGDDVLDPTFLERCLAEFVRDPFLEFVATQTDFIDEAGVKIEKDNPILNIPRAANKPRDSWLLQLYYGNQYFGAGMYRTQPLQDIGGWDSTVGAITDYDVYLKLLQRENIHIIEENLTHTRSHPGQQSVMKTRAQMQELRQFYRTSKTRYYQPRMKVIIATPFYEMRGFSPYIASLVGTVTMLAKMNIEHEFWELSGDSYVDRAKNTLFNKFLEDCDATDLFMIDSDMQWNPQAVIDMLMLPDDIVQGSYPQKNQWEVWTSFPHLTPDEAGNQRLSGRVLSNGATIIKAAALAGGFLRIKRGCLEKYKEHYKDYVYQDHGADPSYPDRVYTEFFTCSREPGPDGVTPMRWGEDRIFGRRMAAIGIESWIYPRVQMGHYGVKGWTGNYEDYLKTMITQPQPATTQ